MSIVTNPPPTIRKRRHNAKREFGLRLILSSLLMYALLGLKVLLCLWCWWNQHRVIVYTAWIWLVQYGLAIGSLWLLVTTDSTQLVLLLHMSILVYLVLLHVTYGVSLSDIWSPAKRRYQRDAPARR